MEQRYKQLLREATKSSSRAFWLTGPIQTLKVSIVFVALGFDEEQRRSGGDGMYGSPLCAACANGHSSIVKRLLKVPNIQKTKGE